MADRATQLRIMCDALREVGCYDDQIDGTRLHTTAPGTHPETLLAAARLAQRATGDPEFVGVEHMGAAMEHRMRRLGQNDEADALRAWLRSYGYDWL